MNQYKKFIFDVDATLVDTQAVIDNIWKNWCETAEVNFLDMCKHIHGRKIEETLRCINPIYANSQQANLVKAIATREMKNARAIPNAKEFVSKLNISSWGIATSGPRQIAMASLQASGFQLPHVMVCAEDVTTGKPSPEPFLKASHDLGAKPCECIAFEDSPSGVLSAKKAGCFVIALLTSHAKSELHDADLIVEGFGDINITRSEDEVYRLDCP